MNTHIPPSGDYDSTHTLDLLLAKLKKYKELQKTTTIDQGIHFDDLIFLVVKTLKSPLADTFLL